MKTTKRLLLALVLLVLAGYTLFTTKRVRHLEARLTRLELALRPAAPLAYAFDDSFMQYFGQQGVDAVNRALRSGATAPDEIVREAARELKLR